MLFRDRLGILISGNKKLGPKLQDAKIGILGGSFDPVHNAHMALARAAYKYANLERLIFLPAGRAPMRAESYSASPADRLEMLKIALEKADFPCEILTVELESDKVSYTVDTARLLLKKYPHRRICWIIGDDHIRKLKYWKDSNELCSMVGFICAARESSLFDLSGFGCKRSVEIDMSANASQGAESANTREISKDGNIVEYLRSNLREAGVPRSFRAEFIPFRRMDVSATRIREILSAQSGLVELRENSMLDCDVLSYIRRKQLYGCANNPKV